MNYEPGPFAGAGQGRQANSGPPSIRPRRLWYLAALVVLLGGIAWLVVGLVSLGGEVNGFPRVALPASGSPVSLSHAGSYVVYYEGPGAASGSPPSFNVRIAPDSAGAAVRSLTPYGSSVTYSFGSRHGRAVLTLQISAPGRFGVTAASAPAGSDLAFGSGIGSSIVVTVVAAVLLMLAGIAGLVVIFVVRLVRSSRLRSRTTDGMAYPAPPGF
jgi:hypothetical protein